jgi:hypothetical protein
MRNTKLQHRTTPVVSGPGWRGQTRICQIAGLFLLLKNMKSKVKEGHKTNIKVM